MRTYFLHVYEKVKRKSKHLVDKSLFVDKRWLMFDEGNENNDVFVFQNDGVLIISSNGIVTRGDWQLIGERDMLVRTHKFDLYFQLVHLDKDLMVFQLDGNNKFLIIVSEVLSKKKFKSIREVESYLADLYFDQDHNNNSEIKEIVDLVMVKFKRERSYFGFARSIEVLRDGKSIGFIGNGEEREFAMQKGDQIIELKMDIIMSEKFLLDLDGEVDFFISIDVNPYVSNLTKLVFIGVIVIFISGSLNAKNPFAYPLFVLSSICTVIFPIMILLKVKARQVFLLRKLE